jgi:hypothetical protein
MEKEGQNGKRKGQGIERKLFFWNCYFLDKSVRRNRKARSANKAFTHFMVRSKVWFISKFIHCHNRARFKLGSARSPDLTPLYLL